MDVSVPEDNVKPKEASPSPARKQQGGKSPLPSDTEMTEISTLRKYERTSEIKEKSETKVLGIKAVVTGRHQKEDKPVSNTTNNVLKHTKSTEPATRGREIAGQMQDSAENVQIKSKTVTKEHVVQEKTTSKLSEAITPPSCPPPRSPSSGHRQLPADPPPKLSQTTKENVTIKSSHTTQGVVERNEQRTPVAKPLLELSSNANTAQQSVTAAPRSTKARAAPPVPMPRSSGSTSVPVPVPRSSGSTSGRSQAPPSDTSGYPDSFSKRKSRDSREIADAALHQLGRSMCVSPLSC